MTTAIPIDWSLDRLSSVTKSYAGGTPDRKNKAYYNGAIPWVKSGEVNQQYISTTEESLTDEGVKNSSAKLVEAGAILVAMYGATAGKVAKLLTNAVTNQAVLSIRSVNNDKLNNDFLFWALRSLTDQMLSACQGAAQPNLSKGLIDGLTLLFPPIEEQKKIASILSAVDNKLDLIDRKITATRTLKKGLMQRLFSQGVGTRDADGHWQPHTEFKDSELGRIPAGWEVLTFKEATKLITCGLAATPKYVEGDGVPFLSAQNVKNGKLVFDNYKLISHKDHEKLYKNNPPMKGDILYTRVGSIGEAAVIDISDQFSIYVSLTLIKVGDRLKNSYLVHLLNSPIYKKLANNEVYIGGGVGNLNVNVVRGWKIALPPLDEQQEIAGVIAKIDKKLDHLATIKAQTQQLKKGLMQKLLTGQWRVKV